MEEIVNQGPIFNWGANISSALNQVIEKYAIICDQQEVEIFMSSYIIDALCVGQHFTGMNWAWRKGLSLIHVCFLELRETKYKYNFDDICQSFVSPLNLCFFIL